MDIIIDYNKLYENMARSLSVIGKRSVDENGNHLFGDITLGTNEKRIADDFFKEAVINIVAEISAFITDETEDASVTLTLPENHNRHLDGFIQRACDMYCVSYALFSWFVITAPKIAGKYKDASIQQMDDIVRLVHEKNAPETSESYTDVTGEVTNK